MFLLSLQDMFVFEITSVKELALGANTELPVNRIKWSTDGESVSSLTLSPYLSLSLSLSRSPFLSPPSRPPPPSLSLLELCPLLSTLYSLCSLHRIAMYMCMFLIFLSRTPCRPNGTQPFDVSQQGIVEGLSVTQVFFV